MNLLRPSQKGPQTTVNTIWFHRILNRTFNLNLPVNVIRVEDHNEPVHAEDDSDEDHSHLGDLQERVQEERMKAAIQIHHVTPRIN